jgi:PAS domain S-box-containing protein
MTTKVSKEELDSDQMGDYDYFFDNSSDAIFITNPNGTIYKANPAATKLFGYSEKEFCSLGRNAIVDPVDPRQILALQERQKTEDYSGTLPYLKKDGTVILCEIKSKFFTSKDGRVRSFIIVKDVSGKIEEDKFHAYHALLIDNISDAVYTFDKNTVIISWNKSAERLYGWKSNEIIGKNARELLRTETKSENLKTMFSALDEKEDTLVETIHYTKDNKKLIIEAHIISLKDEHGNINAYMTVNRDITQHKQLAEHLRYENERLEILTELSGIYVNAGFDLKYLLDYTTRKLADKIGDACIIKLLSTDGSRFDIASLCHRDPDAQSFLTDLYSNKVYLINESFSGQVLVNDKPLLLPVVEDLSLLSTPYKEYAERFNLSSVVIVPIQVEGKIIGTLSLSRNTPGNPYTLNDQLFLQNVAGKIGFAIIKARLFNDKLREIGERKSALKDKEVLLRELYHRTKNNMQVVHSLLGLKGAAVDDNYTKDVLADIGYRIQAIALVHEKLYQSKNLSRIDLKDYLSDLANLLMRSYHQTDKNIKLILDLENINVLIDTAIPCGQIIVELISNSFKYAFPHRREGKISIRLSGIDQDLIELRISDNGIGISDNSKLTSDDTLGMRLLKNIAETQLHGFVCLDTANGFSWTVRFKDVLYKERI